MKTVTYSEILEDVRSKCGIDSLLLSEEQADDIRLAVNRALREIWQDFPWPETMVFVDLTNSTDIKGWAASDMGTNGANIEYVFGAWKKDPRLYQNPTSYKVRYIDDALYIPDGVQSLTIAYVRTASQIPSSTPVDLTASPPTGTAGTFGLTTDGEYFEIQAATVGDVESGGATLPAAKVKDGNQSIASGTGEKTLWHYIPRRLQTAIVLSATADFLATHPQEGKDPDKFRFHADNAVEDAADRVSRQDGDWFSFVTRYSIPTN